MFVAYCTVCKVVLGWGDNDISLKTTRHSSGEFEEVEQLDAEGNPVLDEHDNPVMVRREITHESNVFEIAGLPENVSNEEMKAYLEETYTEEMV